MEWYLKVLRQYADFDGRARRKEYWMFLLFNIVFATLLSLLAGFGIPMMFLILIIYAIAILVPGLAVTIRRLHDIGKSGWMFFIHFIPIIGPIWLLVLLVKDSQPGDNKYGPNPKATQQSAYAPGAFSPK